MMNPGAWRRWRRLLLALTCAVAIGCFAFVLRFNSLSGSLGGFTNDQFVPLMRVEMLLRGEQPLRDFADAELRGAWPALTYLSSTWAQQIGGRTLLPEAYLTVGAIALAHALVFLVTLDATGRWSLAWLSAALCVATAPRLYSYPKVLMLVVGMAALRAVTSDPSVRRLWLAAVATGVTFLFRHDCGGYVAIGIAAGLVARDAGNWRAVGRRVGTYLGATALCLLPSAIWVQVYEGVFTYVRNNLVVAGLEAGRTELDVSDVTLWALVQGSRLDVLTYYGLWATVIAAALALAWRLCGRSRPQLSREDRGFAVGVLALAAVTNQFLLRDPLVARLSDAVAPVAVLRAWTIAASRELAGPIERRLVTVPVWCLLVFMIGASWVFMGVTRTLTDSGLSDSPRLVAARFERVRNNLMRLPPTDWSGIDARGSMAAARYVAECTSPDDYLFIAGDAPEITVFARRRFAAGQGVVAKVWYASEADQRRALARLASQSVPVILADARLFASDFVVAYELLARYVEEHYREVGTIADESRPLIVFVDKRRQPVRTDPRLGFPCFA